MPPEGDWRVWLILTGRGWGKTRCGAEWVRAQVISGRARRIALVAPTAADARDVMVTGESGIMAIGPDAERPIYESSKRRVVWPNGAIATLYSAEEPERLRGPQHDAAWCDELAAWRYLDAAWSMLMMGLRLGDDPRCVVTTTPKPRSMLKDMMDSPHTHLTRGATFDNLDNLAPQFREQIVSRYEGTRLGRQELHGEYLADVEGALWQRQMIDGARIDHDALPELVRIVVAIDPAVTSGEDSDETGIVAVGVDADSHYYVLEDATCRLSPLGWAQRAVSAYGDWHADRIVAEVNNGGDLVEATIRQVDRNVAYRAVHASRGKRVRAEPVSALYEQGRVHHVGMHQELEDQMCNFVPDQSDGSPDRVDALVWGVTDLLSGARTHLTITDIF